MAIKKELSKSCTHCGVVFDEKLTNKQPKRALCKPCYKIELQKISKSQKDKRAEIGAIVNRVAIYKDYKFENRQGFWKELNKEIRPLTKREDIRAFLSKQMDRILADDNLMKYLNSVTMAEQRNEYRNIK
jgi:protein-arginine kinase activator protein McsA